jgi:release factor glutamine methyltransferase
MHEDPAVVTRLRAAGCVFAEEEARVLAAAARTADELESMVERRVRGLPLEHIVGWAEFYGLRILVDPGVFVPRPRSEFLVKTAIALSVVPSPVVVDLCCGTGALGLAVISKLGGGELHAADVDPAAVACARRNVEPAGGCVYLGDLYTPLPSELRGRVTTLLCNAPYVPTRKIALLPAEARDYEHRVALDGGDDGLAVLRRAASQASGWLAPGGHLLVETSGRQASLMGDVMTAARLTSRVHECVDYGSAVISGTMSA